MYIAKHLLVFKELSSFKNDAVQFKSICIYFALHEQFMLRVDKLQFDDKKLFF